MDAMAGLKIGEFAAAAGVGRDAVRHYERIGLLPAVVRNGAGYRVYSDDDLERLRLRIIENDRPGLGRFFDNNCRNLILICRGF